MTKGKEEIFIPPIQKKLPLHQEKVVEYQQDTTAIFSFRNFSLVNVQYLEETLSDSNSSESFKNLTTAIQMNSDVIKGVYEGGLKIWECTEDLLDYLEKEAISFKDMNVLDLGCGAGVLGIQAVHREACSVHFQDYNTEVLELVTIPNVLLNMPTADVEKRVKLFSGDWELLEDMLDLYDVVLTAETIYSPENYLKLLSIFDKVTKPSGVIYVAAKQHYFGVGGNLRQFEKLLMESKKWRAESVFVTEEGIFD
uniref:protein-histidine N-methyltransferase n=1 Tax=Moina brachiata TaxID=675436 RepID=A0A4Y7NK11_9CRUS|nr:EOG090X0C09 [Moina brachiata]